MARQVLTIPDVPPTLLQAATAAATYVAKTGDVMTGLLNVDITGTALQAKRAADTQPRVGLGTNVNSAGGGIEFGSGSVAFDTRIFRNGPAQLQTNAQWDNNLVLKESSAWAFRHGASNFGTPIYAQFGYAGDGNNPRMQFGCNAWFAPYGSTRPTPTKQVSGLASGVIIVEAGGSGGAVEGRVLLTEFIWQDGGWTTGYYSPMKLYNNGAIDLEGARPFLTSKHSGSTTFARWGAVAPDGLWMSCNARYDGTNWLRDDTAKASTMFSLGSDGGLAFYNKAAGANPVGSWVNRLAIGSTGQVNITPNAGVNGITVDTTSGYGIAVVSGGGISMHDPTNNYSMGWKTVANTRLSVTYLGNALSTYFENGGQLTVNAAITCNNGNITAINAEGTGTSVRIGSAYGIPGVYSSGHLTLHSEANVVLQARGSGVIQLNAQSSIHIVQPNGSYTHPAIDNQLYMGHGSYRFVQFAAVNGTINTCRADEKDILGLIDPEDALDAVLRTPIKRYHPKRADDVVDTSLTFAGIVDDSADPRMQIGDGSQTSATHQAAMALAAIQALAARMGITL